jgi:hypothetical protein
MHQISRRHRFPCAEPPVRVVGLSGDEAAAISRVLQRERGETLQSFVRGAIANEIERRHDTGPPPPRIDPRSLIG